MTQFLLHIICSDMVVASNRHWSSKHMASVH